MYITKAISLFFLFLLFGCSESLPKKTTESSSESPVDLALLSGNWASSNCDVSGLKYEKRFFTFTEDFWYIIYNEYNDSNCVELSRIKTNYFYNYDLKEDVTSDGGVASRKIEADGPYSENETLQFFEFFLIAAYVNDCLYLSGSKLTGDEQKQNILKYSDCIVKVGT